MIEIPYEGGCQCQAIRYRVSALPFVAYACHCRACQRLTSSAFATCMHVPAEALAVIKGSPAVGVRESDAGNILQTYFCGSCGTALFTANNARPRLRTIYVGTLDHPHEVEVSAHIWTSRKLPWVVLPPRHRIFSAAGDWRQDYIHDPIRLAK